MLLPAPRTAEVVVAQLAGRGVARDGVEPVGQLDEQPGGLAAEELGSAVDGLGQAEPAAGGRNRGGVANLGQDLDHVGQGDLLAARVEKRCHRDGAAASVGADLGALHGTGAGSGICRVGSPSDVKLLGTNI